MSTLTDDSDGENYIFQRNVGVDPIMQPASTTSTQKEVSPGTVADNVRECYNSYLDKIRGGLLYVRWFLAPSVRVYFVPFFYFHWPSFVLFSILTDSATLLFKRLDCQAPQRGSKGIMKVLKQMRHDVVVVTAINVILKRSCRTWWFNFHALIVFHEKVKPLIITATNNVIPRIWKSCRWNHFWC